MAKIELLPRKVFEIHLENGEVIRGKFSVWSAKRFCQKKGISLTDYIDDDKRKELYKNDKDPVATHIDDMVLLILCAVEHFFVENGKSCLFNEVNIHNWVEELGGFDSDNIMSLYGHVESELEPEKKSQVVEQI